MNVTHTLSVPPQTLTVDGEELAVVTAVMAPTLLGWNVPRWFCVVRHTAPAVGDPNTFSVYTVALMEGRHVITESPCKPHLTHDAAHRHVFRFLGYVPAK